MKFKKIVLFILAPLMLLSSCSAGSDNKNTQQNNPSDSILVNGLIGQFSGSYVSTSVTRLEKAKDSSSKTSTRSLSLVIDQTKNTLSVTVYNGTGTTGFSLVDFDRLHIDLGTQVLSKPDYNYDGLIGEKGFTVSNRGTDYSNGSVNNPVDYLQELSIQRLSTGTLHLKLEVKNHYIGSTLVYHNIFEGDFELE